MSSASLLLVLGLGLVGFIGYVIALAIGEFALDELKDAIFRGRSMAIRRQRQRPFLIAGYVVFIGLALMPAFVGTAVATNGRSDGPQDARWFFAIAGIGLTVAAVLIAEWWRRSAKP
jgi:hypothetical protein